MWWHVKHILATFISILIKLICGMFTRGEMKFCYDTHIPHQTLSNPAVHKKMKSFWQGKYKSTQKSTSRIQINFEFMYVYVMAWHGSQFRMASRNILIQCVLCNLMSHFCRRWQRMAYPDIPLIGWVWYDCNLGLSRHNIVHMPVEPYQYIMLVI